MALQTNTTLDKGIVAPNCYVKILEVRYLKEKYPIERTGINILLGFYFNKEIRDDDEYQFIYSKEYFIKDITKETRESQYEYLKTLEEFEDATNI